MSKSNVLEGRTSITLLKIALPIMIGNLLQLLYNFTDTYWLGKLGAEAMAAITVISPVQSVIISFGGGLSAGGAVVMSQCFGAGDDSRCKKAANQLFALIMCFSVVAAIVLYFFCRPMLGAMGAVGEVAEIAITYQQIMVIDIPLLYIVNIYTAINNAEGKTAKPLVFNFIGIVLNMILDPLFIVDMGWGAAGAALATVFAKLPGAVIAMRLMVSRKKRVHLSVSMMKFDWHMIKNILKVSLPMSIGNSAMSFGFVLMSKSVMSYGTLAVAAYGIGNKINGIVSSPSMAMGNAVSIMSGQAKGAGRPEKAGNAWLCGMGMMCMLLVVTGFIISRNSISTAIIHIFSDDVQVIEYGAHFLAIMSLWSWTNGVYDSSKGYLNGQGKTVSTVTVNAARLWVFRFAILFVCERILKIGVGSIWYAVTFSNALAAVTMSACAVWYMKRKRALR